METKIHEIINLILINRKKNKVDEISNEHHLRDYLNLDSLDLAELTVRIENEFGIDVFEDGIVETVGEIIEKLKKNE
ncbi:MAG TPA: acyl carrier protein [Ignavibacteriaceae bacterium]|nr:acyl carrier protein [Ignavibacteriaceae bacterium]